MVKNFQAAERRTCAETNETSTGVKNKRVAAAVNSHKKKLLLGLKFVEPDTAKKLLLGLKIFKKTNSAPV